MKGELHLMTTKHPKLVVRHETAQWGKTKGSSSTRQKLQDKRVKTKGPPLLESVSALGQTGPGLNRVLLPPPLLLLLLVPTDIYSNSIPCESTLVKQDNTPKCNHSAALLFFPVSFLFFFSLLRWLLHIKALWHLSLVTIPTVAFPDKVGS